MKLIVVAVVAALAAVAAGGLAWHQYQAHFETRTALASIPGRSAPMTRTSAAVKRSASAWTSRSRTPHAPASTPCLPPARLICRHARLASLWRHTNIS